ncbi:hypothetical protein SEA_BUMBLE_37 [Arthrobacter phage Bumble]|uniref:Uncharacterized protein n=1 Tax=Arthrobacter phage Bumble TaxID=2743904 RepID=A0A7G3VC81_9CAUD|nr:hypothetical protein SEA_BUMBLE_37 [Arthrobacter phage Bumble]
MTEHDHDHNECLDAPAFELTISRDGVLRCVSEGAHPRITAAMLRRVADSLDEAATQRGLPELPPISSEVLEVNDPDEAEAKIAEYRASNPRNKAPLN